MMFFYFYALIIYFLILNATTKSYNIKEETKDNTKDDSHLFSFHIPFDHIFRDEWKEVYLTLRNTTFGENKNKIFFEHNSCSSCELKFFHFEPVAVERTCLISPLIQSERTSTVYKQFSDLFDHNNNNITIRPPDLEDIVKFVNSQSNSFQLSNGSLNALGNILDKNELYTINSSSDHSCPTIDYNNLVTNPRMFVEQFWLPQRPVVIDNYPLGLEGSTLISLLGSHLDRDVGCKLSPSKDYEGVDSLLNWGMAKEQNVPRRVLDQMQSPDLVVVRAAHKEMRLRDALDVIAQSQSNQSSIKARLYVEYQSTDVLPGLVEKLLPNKVLPGGLHELFLRGKSFLWLGDGDTVGKLHFDPFDNILVQIAGSKSFRLTDPSQNERLYEGHMREAELELIGEVIPSRIKELQSKGNISLAKPFFRKHKLTESTSMVHSPVNISDIPGSSYRYPKSRDVKVQDCLVKAGQAIFVPSFFWHEVTSSPNHLDNNNNNLNWNNMSYNMAINFWFEPLFKKEFPCAICRKQLNKKYRQILQSFFSK